MKYPIILLTIILATGCTLQAQTGSKATDVAGNCSYFPVKNGLKFSYKRNNLLGEQTITETYTFVKDKTLKSGKVIKGYKINSTDANRNNTIIYYYCDSGSTKMYSEMPAYNTQIKGYVEDYSVLSSDYNKPDYKKPPIWETEKTGSGKYLSFTELKNGNAGTTWTDVQIVNDNPVTISTSIEETNIEVTVRGQTYFPVIHVKRTVRVNAMGQVIELNTQDIYYAKGIGKIKMTETGQDLLAGNYTTTQELVSHNLPAQPASKATDANKKPVQAKGTGASPSYKLGESAMTAICDKWCGSYKLTEKDGQPVSDFPYGEYLHLETEGDGIIMILQKKSGKLYETGKETPIEWSVWMENNEQVIYIRTASETKGKAISKGSTPRKKIVFGNKVYEYVKREVEYF